MNYFNYFTEIEETFVRRRGKHLFLSPIDWAMIEGWQQRGIPLHVVIRGIETVFDAFDKKPGARSIKGLLYCREEIEAQYEEWLASQVGKGGEASAAELIEESVVEIAAKIENAIERLESLDDARFAEDFARACERLAALGADLSGDQESIDGFLLDIEKFLDQALIAKADEAHLSNIQGNVARQLKPYKSGMDAAAYEQTSRLMVLKQLRDEIGVPRLGLFYL